MDAQRMAFQPDSVIRIGDWVRTPAGDKGRVAGINRRTVYVKCGKGDRLDSFLLSRLTKIQPLAESDDQGMPGRHTQ